MASFPNKEKRESCWQARDKYWDCLRENVPDYQPTSGSPEPNECLKLRKLFESNCPGQWVKHFDRKLTYEQFKKRMEKGFDPLDGKK